MYTTHLKEAHSSLVSPVLAVGLEVPQREVGEVESFSPSLNITFILKGTTANRQQGTWHMIYIIDTGTTLCAESLGGIDRVVSVARDADGGSGDAQPAPAEPDNNYFIN